MPTGRLADPSISSVRPRLRSAVNSVFVPFLRTDRFDEIIAAGIVVLACKTALER